MNSLKRKIIRYLARFFYPQNIFGKSIVSVLKEKKNISVIIDAPCGNGETTYHLSKIKSAKVFGYDISHESINWANETFQMQNLKYESCDIFQVFEKHKKIDVFCVINSFFLLPHQDLLLSHIHNILNDDGLLILILPNIEGKNYRNFLEVQNKNKINTLVLSPSQFNTYFQKHNFRIVKMKGIVYAHFYNRAELKFLSVLSHFYLSLLNYFQSFLKINRPNYYLLVLTKYETI